MWQLQHGSCAITELGAARPPCLSRPQSYDAGEFEALAEKYEKLNWRIIRCVGGREGAG